MTSVRLPEDIATRLDQLSAITARSKSFYIKEALTAYLDDMEDILIAQDRINRPSQKRYTTEEVLKQLDND